MIDAGEGPIVKKQRPSYDTRDPRLQDRPYAEARPYDNRRQNYPDTRQLYTKVAELDKKLTDATIASALPATSSLQETDLECWRHWGTPRKLIM